MGRGSGRGRSAAVIEVQGRSPSQHAPGDLRPQDWLPNPTRRRTWAWVGLGATAGLSILAWALVYSHGLVLTYNDSVSHLDIARQVVNSQQPGLAQLGGVWLPLNQLLYLPLVWMDWAWRSGFAGSYVSMASFVTTVVAVFATVREITNRRATAVLAGVAVALSPNFLYLQATPLTEPLYVALLALAALFFVRYLKVHNPRQLVAMSIFTALAVAARYDGWFVAGAGAVLLLQYELRVHNMAWRRAAGVLMLYLAPVLFVMGLWLVWNLILFGSPFYSFIGPDSAHAEQAVIQARAGLITHFNLRLSLEAYALDAWANLGPWLSILGAAGWVLYLLTGSAPRWYRVSLLIYFGSEFVFNVLALFLGFSILNLPSLHWSATGGGYDKYFNTRYGITMLPMAAVGLGLLLAPMRAGRAVRLARRRRRRHLLRSAPPWVAAGVLSGLLAAQAVGMTQQGLITVKDGTVGLSAFIYGDVAAALHRLVRPDQQVLLSESYIPSVVLRSGLASRQFIYEGVRRKWKAALRTPSDYAAWIVMAKGKVGDPVYDSLVQREHDAFLSDYRLVYHGQHANIFERKPLHNILVTRDGTELRDGYARFTARGANSYDLAYQTPSTIRETLRNLQYSGINTVRFWLFGDGFPGGFQPEAGEFNNQPLGRVDYLLMQAHRDGIRVIPTLLNNWAAYGGVNQYLRWLGLPISAHDEFFSNQRAVALYENYIRHILTHVNSRTGIEYGRDPTILAWDIANEPRVSPADTPKLIRWVGQISSYVHHIGATQLATVSLDAPTLARAEGAICAQQYVGFCSAHFYPVARQGSLRSQLRLIDRYQERAASVHRPIVMTEVGVSKQGRPFGKSPLSVLRDTVKRIGQDGYAGWAIWDYAQQPDASYGFSPDGLEGRYTLSQLHSLAALVVRPSRRDA